MTEAAIRASREDMGQFSLFGAEETIGATSSRFHPPWDKKIKLGFERQMLGLYVSDHPLFGVESQLRALAPPQYP